MQYGVCAAPGEADILAEAGFDFIEGHVQSQLMPEADEKAFAEPLGALQSSPLPCVAANCFVPGHLPITGTEVRLDALQSYVRTAFDRAAQAGIETIVFGSGGARKVPDGFDRDTAWDQLLAFGRMIGPEAAARNVTIVVEPLNQDACNVLTSVGESASYVRQVDHPSVRLLVDAFHWKKDDNDADAILDAGPLLGHVHIATEPGRMAPGREPCDFTRFFDALLKTGYDGRISVEALWSEDRSEAPVVLETLRQAVADAKG